jgi:hypothetical protein
LILVLLGLSTCTDSNDMTKHNVLSNANLHTPKGAASASKSQIPFAESTGIVSFRTLLEGIDLSLTTLGEWDYTADGLDGSGYVVFPDLDKYCYIELDCFDLTSTGTSYVFGQVGTSSGWKTSSTYKTCVFEGDLGATDSFAESNFARVLRAGTTADGISMLRLYNFNQAFPTILQVRGQTNGASNWSQWSAGIENSGEAQTRFRLKSLTSTITGGTIFVRGIRL